MVPRRGAALVLGLALPLLAAGCFGPGYEAGWRIVDRDRGCSECEAVVMRSGHLDGEWAGRVEARHDLWGTYADPDAEPARIVANWTVSVGVQPMLIEFGGRVFHCGFEGGNATTDAGSFSGADIPGPADWRITVRPGVGTCEADVQWGEGWSATIVSWFFPEGQDGAYEPVDVAFTARRL